MRVRTDHQIVAFGNNLMGLFDGDGTQLVTATRTETGWEITADGADPVTATSRAEAVTAMTDTALAILPGDGYSCLVPHGLTDQP